MLYFKQKNHEFFILEKLTFRIWRKWHFAYISLHNTKKAELIARENAQIQHKIFENTSQTGLQSKNTASRLKRWIQLASIASSPKRISLDGHHRHMHSKHTTQPTNISIQPHYRHIHIIKEFSTFAQRETHPHLPHDGNPRKSWKNWSLLSKAFGTSTWQFGLADGSTIESPMAGRCHVYIRVKYYFGRITGGRRVIQRGGESRASAKTLEVVYARFFGCLNWFRFGFGCWWLELWLL